MKTIVKKNSWEKVWIVHGEPYLCKLSIIELTKDSTNIIKHYSDTDEKEILQSLTSFSFMNNDTCVIIYEPKKTFLTTLVKIIESNHIVVPYIIVYLPQTELDTKNEFYKLSVKNKRNFLHSYTEINNQTGLKSFLVKIWAKNNEIRITPKALSWLINNAPTKFVKINDIKEIEVYNLDSIDSELQKINTITNEINEDNIKNYCTFDQASNIWDCINTLLTGKLNNIYDKVKAFGNINGLLRIAKSQIEFILQIRSLYDCGITNITSIQHIMSYSTLQKQYECVLPITKKNKETGKDEKILPNPPNYYRIKKTLENISAYDIDILSNQLIVVNCAIADLQSAYGIDDIIADYVLMAINQKIKYEKPFFV